MGDISDKLQQQVSTAFENGTPLRIEGHNTKAFLGNPVDGERMALHSHAGIISYDPSELVITARSGTTIKAINDTLTEHNQVLPFEPPLYNNEATLGGTIACNVSGPARPYYGAARDFVLGAKILNGKGEILQFGGQVMKNVAGYDASRLMAGAFGTLGVLLELSLKVLPKPHAETTLVANLPDREAITTMNELAGKNIPLTASCFYEGSLYLRLESSENNTQAVANQLIRYLDAGKLADSETFWQQLREQQHEFFSGPAPLWRLSVPPTSTNISLPGTQLIEWGGALRWLRSNASEKQVRDAVTAADGHAAAYKNIEQASTVFQPLGKTQMLLHRQLKQAFDPAGILNPGKMYSEL